MSEYRDKVIEKIAQHLYSRTAHYANRNDFTKAQYISDAQQLLKAIPELAIVDRATKFPEMNYSNERDNGVHQATKSKMKQEGFVREVKE